MYQSGAWANNANIVVLIQFSLYANMAEYLTTSGQGGEEIPFSGSYDPTTLEIMELFQHFMRLDPVDQGYPDLITMLSLVPSNGYYGRYFWAVDTSKQLTPVDIQNLVDYEVSYIGRYLTGSAGESYVPKFLTKTECENILSRGFGIIPIYQDNYPVATYYNYNQGWADAHTAGFAAAKLGLPSGSFIYFAVDFDATDDEIFNYVIPYFKGIQAALVEGGEVAVNFQTGVYGTRNVCTEVSKGANTKRSYVSNMSSGWSGNLGFSQPLDWAFDQFYELKYAGIPIDLVNISGLDKGVSFLDDVTEIDKNYWVMKTNWDWIKNPLLSGELIWDGPALVTELGPFHLEISANTKISTAPEAPGTITLDVTNGEVAQSSQVDLENIFGEKVALEVESKIDEYAIGMSVGQIKVSAATDETGMIGTKFEFNFPEVESNDIEVGSSVEVTISMRKGSTGSEALNEAMQQILNIVGVTAIGVVLFFIGLEILAAGGIGLTLEALASLIIGFVAIFQSDK